MASKRATLLRRELNAVLAHYDIGAIRDARAFERGSHESPKAIINAEKGVFLLKRRPPRDEAVRVAFSHSLQIYLLKHHFPLPRLIPTRDDGLSMLTYEDSVYELYEYIDGKHYSGSIPETVSSGKTLGLYHHLVQEFQSPWDPPQGHYHNSPMVYEALDSIAEVLLRDKPPDASAFEKAPQVVTNIREQYSNAAKAADEIGLSKWRMQIVHSDWHPGNLIFDGGVVCAVLDFDSARVRPRVMDVANGCLQFSMITGGRDLTKWEDALDLQRLRGFLSGYESIELLTEAELACIPALMREAIIAQALRPIMRSGTIAGLDGTRFLEVVSKKATWITENLPSDAILNLVKQER